MVNITIFTRNSAVCGFSSVGHAGQNAHGKDIVCAAVSALTINCANALETIANASPIVKQSDGYLTVEVLESHYNHDAFILLTALQQGLTDIVASYPKYISIRKVEK